MGCFRIMNDNYWDSQTYANKDASSEQSAFPSSNAENKKRRARVWRSNGYYNVTSSNNTIIFEETAAANLTATIAVAEYTSFSSFAAAVKAAFEAVGGSTYTIAQDSTSLKITITSDGVGGGGILNLEWDNVSTTAAGLLGFDDGATDTSALTYTADFLRIHSEEFITIDMGLPSDFENFIMVGRRNTPIQISETGTYKLQANPTDTWSSPAFDSTLTYDDEVIASLGTAATGLAGTKHRFWRLSFVDNDNPNGYVEISNIFLGNAFGDSTTGRVQFPFTSQMQDQSRTIVTEGGSSFSNVKQKIQSFNVKWFNLKKAEIEEYEAIFNEFGTSAPFFVSMDTSAVFSTSALRKVKYVKFDKQPQWTLEKPDIFSLTMSFREEV